MNLGSIVEILKFGGEIRNLIQGDKIQVLYLSESHAHSQTN